MRRLFRVTRDLTGNLPLFPAVFPDALAPVVRVAFDGERELSLMRWGFPAAAESRQGSSHQRFATSRRPIGAAGSRRNGAASSRRHHSANGPTAGRR
jgi:putative SOS response-associated peptidase YedK